MNPHGYPPGGGHPGPPGYGHGHHPPPGYGHGHPPPHGPPGYGYPPPKKGPSGATIFLWILIAFVVLVFGSCMVCSHIASSRLEEAADDFVEDVEKRAEERKKKRANPKEMSIEELHEAFDDGEGDKLIDEYVRFDGKVEEITEKSSRAVLIIAPEDAKKGDDGPRVACKLRLRSQASTIKLGKTVTVLGEIEARVKNVELDDCSIE